MEFRDIQVRRLVHSHVNKSSSPKGFRLVTCNLALKLDRFGCRLCFATRVGEDRIPLFFATRVGEDRFPYPRLFEGEHKCKIDEAIAYFARKQKAIAYFSRKRKAKEVL